MRRNKKTIEDIFASKMRRRKDLADLPVEEKIKILVHLQKVAAAIFLSRGIKKRPWKL